MGKLDGGEGIDYLTATGGNNEFYDSHVVTDSRVELELISITSREYPAEPNMSTSRTLRGKISFCSSRVQSALTGQSSLMQSFSLISMKPADLSRQDQCMSDRTRPTSAITRASANFSSLTHAKNEEQETIAEHRNLVTYRSLRHLVKTY